MNIDYKAELQHLSDISQKRKLRPISKRDGKYSYIGEEKFLDCSSNDYLAIAGDSSLREKFLAEVNIAELGFSASASRLLSGSTVLHEQLEELVSSFYYNKESLVFNSGYHANLGIIPVLVGKQAVVFADKQVHASIIDGILLSGAKLYRYKHNDMRSLQESLKKYRRNFNNAWIITESIFSMDGDTANINEIIMLKEQFDVSLYVDEAHAFGVRGKNGAGVCVELGIDKDVDIIVGTFGKALASVGAFVACDSVLKEFLINKARSFIFSTAVPPINIAWTKWLIENVVPAKMDNAKILSLLADEFRALLINKGYKVLGDSQIVPLIVGDNDNAVLLSKQLEEAGVIALAVRPPTVPVGSSRLRFSLNAGMDSADIRKIVDAI